MHRPRARRTRRSRTRPRPCMERHAPIVPFATQGPSPNFDARPSGLRSQTDFASILRRTPMMNRIRFALLPLCTFALTVACGDTNEPPAVASVEVSAPAGDLLVGQTTQLSATARDEKGNALSNRAIDWTTSNASIATVSTTGLVTGVAAGQATITATSEGKTGSRTVNILPPPVATVSVTAASNALQV